MDTPPARRTPPAWLVFLSALIVYGLAAGPTLTRQSIAPHYVYLADALLHGRLDLIQPPSAYDLLVVDGRAYVAGSPLPAILLAPFVALFGNDVSDILFGVIVGALNVALAYDLLGKRGEALTASQRLWLTALFAFGTPHLYLATLGSYWFNAHVVAIGFGLLAVRELMQHPPSNWGWFRSGLWLACAGFARPTMLFSAAFVIALIAFTQQGRERLRALAPFAAALAVGLAAHGAYNAARFGSPFDFGYQYTAGAPNITTTYARYGGFNPRFLPCNLFVSLAGPPEVNGYVPPITYTLCSYLLDGVNLSDAATPIAPNPLGMSLFLTTPAFILLFAARRRDPITDAAWVGLLAVSLPSWLYHNTGSLQFGYRYWLDAAPMWLLLLAVTKAPTTTRAGLRVSAALILVSIAINVWGFLWMFEKFAGASWLAVMLRGA